MRVTQKKAAFNPVNIELESQNEVDVLYAVLVHCNQNEDIEDRDGFAELGNSILLELYEKLGDSGV